MVGYSANVAAGVSDVVESHVELHVDFGVLKIRQKASHGPPHSRRLL